MKNTVIIKSAVDYGNSILNIGSSKQKKPPITKTEKIFGKAIKKLCRGLGDD